MKKYVLIGMLLTLTGCKRVEVQDPVFDCRYTLSVLDLAVSMFKGKVGRLPTEKEGLRVLSHELSELPSVENWSELIKSPDWLIDPWGNEYKYIVDEELHGGYVVYSVGPMGLIHSREKFGYDASYLWKWLPESERKNGPPSLAHTHR